MAAQKSWRDWLYLGIVATQLFGMIVLDFQTFYPSSLYASPSSPLHILTTIRETYVSFTGDPFFSTYHAAWFESFLYLEALVQFPLAVFLVFQLSSCRPSSWSAELAALAFGCVTAYGSVACCAELREMGVDIVSEEQKKRLFWGTYFPFALIPTFMAVDMCMRLTERLQVLEEKTKTQ